MSTTPIVCVHVNPQRPPLALGQLLAYARTFVSDSQYDFTPRFVHSSEQLERLFNQLGPVVVLFSNYLWNIEPNLELSSFAKRLDQRNVTIHGGPSTPSYEFTCSEFLIQNTHVDFVVHNEGEQTLVELLQWLADERQTPPPNGIGFLSSGELELTALRAHILDINVLPSPYLTDVFSELDSTAWESATVETNRGCPYRCTFCDWGSATRQKIRQFSVERVTRELRWLVEKKIPEIWLADANFGILSRDVEIARTICSLKNETGYPNRVVVNYAKNTHKYLVEIVEMFVDAGLVSTGIISLQTRDEGTLAAVHRKNIKTCEYDNLRDVFRKKCLPLTTQLMIGLPGSTLESLKNDLRTYYDTEVQVQCFRTALLPNSPMADPKYVAEHQLVFDERGLVESSTSFRVDEMRLMCSLVRAFNFAHKYGAIRHVLRFLKWDYGIDPVDFLDQLIATESLSFEFPMLSEILDSQADDIDLLNTHIHLRNELRRDSLWSVFYEQLDHYIQGWIPSIDRTALSVTLRAQQAVMPDASQTFPATVPLAHDFAIYTSQQLQAPFTAKALGSYPPGTLTVDDPHELSLQPLTQSARRPGHLWELSSDLGSKSNQAYNR